MVFACCERLRSRPVLQQKRSHSMNFYKKVAARQL